jgi:hypothetical protein
MDQPVEQFLEHFAEFAPLCDSLDIVGVAVEHESRLEPVCVRITFDDITDTLQTFGRWRVFRRRCAARQFPEMVRAFVETGRLQIADDLALACSAAPKGWYRNDFARTPAVYTSGFARLTWLSANCGGKTFPSNGDHEHFSRLIATSNEYHDVADLVTKLGLRQALMADESRALRFEIEPPLYFRRADWTADQVALRFAAPATLDLSEIRVKWQTKQTKGSSQIARAADLCSVVVSTSDEQLDATVIYRTFSLWNLSEGRPQKLVDYFPNLNSDEDDVPPKAGPDYSRFETTRRTLRISIKKQVGGDATLYKIIARDIDDAVSCLDDGRYKLAAILAGAIVEATLLGRLSGESTSDLEAAFRAVFPKHSPTRAVPVLDDLKLYQLILVAEKRGKLKDHKLYDGIRDWRNFIHPNLEATEGSIDITAAQIAVTAAVRLLLGKS